MAPLTAIRSAIECVGLCEGRHYAIQQMRHLWRPLRCMGACRPHAHDERCPNRYQRTCLEGARGKRSKTVGIQVHTERRGQMVRIPTMRLLPRRGGRFYLVVQLVVQKRWLLSILLSNIGTGGEWATTISRLHESDETPSISDVSEAVCFSDGE